MDPTDEVFYDKVGEETELCQFVVLLWRIWSNLIQMKTAPLNLCILQICATQSSLACTGMLCQRPLQTIEMPIS